MKFLGITLLTLFFTQCASVQFDKNAPFTVRSATRLADENLKIYYTATSKINFVNLYFGKRKEKIELGKDDNGTFITGSFKKSLSNLKDIQLHSDPKKEYGNTPPKIEKTPFELKENEAVISYKINEEIRYYKVKTEI